MNRRRFLKAACGLFLPSGAIAQSITRFDLPWMAQGQLPLTRPAVFTCADGGLTANWVSRVIANGGATPSLGTQAAAVCFGSALISAGINANFLSLNLMVPDNTVAVLTPYIVGTGTDPWTTSVTILPGFLSTAGLLAGNGFGVSEIDSGCPTSSFSTSAMGLHVYGASPGTLPILSVGGGGGGHCAEIFCNGTSIPFYVASYQPWEIQPLGGVISNSEYGFVSANRTGASQLDEYIANGNHAFQSLSATSTAPAGTGPIGGTLGYQVPGVCAGISGQCTLSFLGFTSVGLTSTQSQALFNAVQAFRQAVNGGFT